MRILIVDDHRRIQSAPRAIVQELDVQCEVAGAKAFDEAQPLIETSPARIDVEPNGCAWRMTLKAHGRTETAVTATIIDLEPQPRPGPGCRGVRVTQRFVFAYYSDLRRGMSDCSRDQRRRPMR